MGRLITLEKKSFHSAKVSVNKGRLYGEEQFKKFLDMSFDDILRYMEEHSFKDEIDKSYIKYEGFYLIEKILNNHLSNIYRKLFVSATQANKKLFETYYLKYQVHNLMVLIRCRLSDEKDIEPYLIGDSRKRSKFVKAMEMASIEDAISYISKKLKLDSTVVLEKYNNNLFELENYLYKTYYERLKKCSFKYNGRDERDFFKFIRRYVDLINARSYVKLKSEDIKIDFNEVYIQGGNLGLDFYESLNSLKIDECMNKIKGEIGELNFEDTSNSVILDKAVSKHKKEAQRRLKKSNFGSPFYALAYLFDVERELGQLRVLLKAKYLEVSKDELKELI